MERMIFIIDALSAWAGKAFSWTILLLAFALLTARALDREES